MSSSLSYDAQLRRTAARLDRLPLTTIHWAAIVILGVLYFFDFGDQFVLAYIAPALIKTWHITINDVVLLNAATFLGMAFGAQIGGLIADRFGRKNAIVWITIWIGVFSLLNAAAPGRSIFLLIRFLTGLGLTALTATVSPYITELYPARLRGRIQGWIMVCAFCGTMLAFLVVPTSAQVWRWLFAYGVVAILALFFIRYLPESPRWLIIHQRQPQADAILDRLETLALKKVTSLLPLDESSVPPPVTRFSYGQLFQGKYLGRTLLVAALFSLITLSVLGFINWVPTLLATRGFSLGKTLQISLLIGIAAPIGLALPPGWPSGWSANEPLSSIVCWRRCAAGSMGCPPNRRSSSFLASWSRSSSRASLHFCSPMRLRSFRRRCAARPLALPMG